VACYSLKKTEEHVAELKDFSSFDPEQEKAFVPFEAFMKANEKRANNLGFGIGGGFFLVAALAVVALYTPCSRFCDRPPIACKGDAEIAAFKRSCESSCASLERERGLSIVREVKIKTTDNKEAFEGRPDKIDGTEFVDMLASCAFSGGGGATCESITKYATTKGLWCEEKK
jgi:hypothetical protein